MQIFTVGYEGHTADSFIELLRDNGIDLLADVRQRAGSRKRGFSKTKLAEMLAKHGIEYRHFSVLGTPADLRTRYKAGQLELEPYLHAYRAHLDGQRESISELAELTVYRRCCLLCVEKRPEDCHRSILADKLASIVEPLTITHL